MRVSPWGVLGASAFLCFAANNLHLAQLGAWQAPLFTAMATLPFSLAANAACDALQASLGWTHEWRNAVEALLIAAVGLVEYYVIGALLERVVRRARKKA